MTCLDHCREEEVKNGTPEAELEGVLQFCCWRKVAVAGEILIYPAAERGQSPRTGSPQSLYNRNKLLGRSPGHLRPLDVQQMLQRGIYIEPLSKYAAHVIQMETMLRYYLCIFCKLIFGSGD